MADNTVLNAGTGGDTIATDDIAGVKYQRVKLSLGADGTAADAPVGGGTESGVLRVTIASDSTGVLSVDDNGGSLTVDVGTALPAGTNNIGDVDVLSVVPGTGATALGKAVDSAAGATDTGVAALFVRDDSLSALTPAEGDYVYGRVDANGAIHVRITAGGISGIVDDAAFTAGSSELVAIGCVADESSTDSVDEGDLGAPRMTLDRKQIVVPQPHTAGGLSIFRSIDLDETEEEAKATAGCVYGMWVTNTATSTRFIKFYNATAANVTVGTTTPVITIGIPGNSSDDVSGNFGPGGMGITFDTAITLAATTGIADNDTGAPGANEVTVNLFYK